MEKRSFTMALERHDRHVPFFMGAVRTPDDVEIVPLEIGVGILNNDRYLFRFHKFCKRHMNLSRKYLKIYKTRKKGRCFSTYKKNG